MLLVAHRTPPTAAGCRDLVALGATMFEVDVQVRPGSDDTVYVSHYLPFRRIGTWLQHDNARFRFGYGPPADPTLAQVLDRIPEGARVLLDPKPADPHARARLAAALAGQLPDRSRFAVSTDREDDLVAYREAGFETWRTIKDRASLRRVLAGPQLPERGASVRHSVLDAPAVVALRERVGPVVAWTVNDVRRAHDLRDLGVDGITTDRGAVLTALGRAAAG